jgi:hypothetical protein
MPVNFTTITFGCRANKKYFNRQEKQGKSEARLLKIFENPK